MARISKMLISKLNIFSLKRQFRHVRVPGDANEVEDFRVRGSDILKAISEDSGSTASTTRSPARGRHHYACVDGTCKSEMELDISIEGSMERPCKFQKYQRLPEDEKENTNGGTKSTTKSINGNERQSKVKRLKYLKRQLELARRKRVENKGSFAINMVTYKENTATTCSNKNGNKGDRGVEISIDSRAASSSVRSSGCDERSQSSISTCVSHDLTLQVIDEATSYYNNT
mmetsp:Transcript_11916/g.26873  ORF Transcript_11916/g.26873 Transcript_11916/m.26873 type:complete len:230 (+) Transcript_11916:84-773(+)|eukprot:CAMPEP_0201261564 /NCGR_PEP_ID=MMETSP0853-20130426/5703_1 /ASSEMBLY_ACC=CAM_ASM_000640 /TAXON_ID=183588 /ORGANISM="Pseudo-nitzschia fraudulenta, Strain WWA7" /LENGTH=229 /DNA_ID=CAMNT_0047564561 /DNA_START=52 /DNA_END=741 /DNA_ORIENTATION=+